ncbi:NAD(P)-binding domain-containing protein [Pararhodobacter sp. SW119]|uniref:NAD(P)-binding domain-containing protein n=1 Tax=Pararhodobacter sp. SW119 TaxID=2780075 RepID=UPI001ADF3940|nr:NAD(P)-binding domain-containing protein [Pararhodobacter sp. SW119]
MNTTTIGILGIGRLGEAVATAALALPDLRALHVTRRSADRVARLQSADTRVHPADPADIARDCDILIVALRPIDARAVLSALRLEPRHHVISLMAEIGLDELRALTAGAASACRLLAMPSVAAGGQILPLYPQTEAADHVFGARNDLLALESEAELMTLWSITGLLSAVLTVGHVAEGWLRDHGVAPDRATAYTRTLYTDIHAATAPGFDAGLDHVSTPGGLNLMVRERLLQTGIEPALEAGLDDVHRRLLAGMARPGTPPADT